MLLLIIYYPLSNKHGGHGRWRVALVPCPSPCTSCSFGSGRQASAQCTHCRRMYADPMSLFLSDEARRVSSSHFWQVDPNVAPGLTNPGIPAFSWGSTQRSRSARVISSRPYMSCHAISSGISLGGYGRSDLILQGLGIWDAGLEHYHAAPWVLLVD